jgi:hypothetical protein
MMKENEQYAYFTLVGDFNPASITARIGLNPTKSWKKGDRSEQTNLERKFSRWSLYSRLDKGRPLERHVDDVLIQLEPVEDKIVAIRSEFEGYLSLVAYFYAGYPGLHFEAPALAKIGKMNLAMDMDFYYLYSDKREDS